MSETETIELKKTPEPLVIEKEENGIKIVEMKPPIYYPGSDYEKMRSVVLLDCGGRAGNGFSSDLQKTVKHYREETKTELLVALGKEMNLPAEMTEMNALPDIFLQTVSEADFSMLREVCCARFYSTDSSFSFTHIDFRDIRYLFSIKKMVEGKACAPKIFYQKSGSLKESADSVASKLDKDTRTVLAIVVGEYSMKEIMNALKSIQEALPDGSEMFWTGIPAESQKLADCKLVVLAMQGENRIAYFYASFEYGSELRFEVIVDSSKSIDDCITEGFAKAANLTLDAARDALSEAILVEETPFSDLADLVKKSDIVIANPINFAVAFKCKSGQSENPLFWLVAKGANDHALFMRRIAEENGIPVVENRPFARGAFVEIDIWEFCPKSYMKTLVQMYQQALESKHTKKVKGTHIMEDTKRIILKRLYIRNFKSFSGETEIDFSEGLNAVITSSDIGKRDFFDAILWPLGLGNGAFSKASLSEVKVTVENEDGKEIFIGQKFSEDTNEEVYTSSEEKAILNLEKYVTFEYGDSLTFGNTKIIATSDKKIAMQAAKMIGITTDESGVSKAFALDNVGE